jgi:lysophospholipid acyltransferase (LPLAT)-like uncharacterized protein
MNIAVIKATEAPVAKSKAKANTHALVEALSALDAENVLSITPDTNKSIVGTKVGISRIAKKAGFDVTSWDDGTNVFVRINR